MAYVITERCIGTKDAACVAVCPVDCIQPTPESLDFGHAEMLYIDPGTCIDCGLCLDECPVTAIFLDDEVPKAYVKYVRINADYFQERRL